ncbi:MAG: site-specific DNA-methyltransferase [Thermoplasmata archaeon]|nr:site-specific DNA-methyltransferase [Thermoplasmata archaeon]
MPAPPTGTVQLYPGDARHLTALVDHSVQLVVTSPPYPMIPQWDLLFAELGAREYPAMLRVLEEAWAECHRVLVEGGLLAVVIGDALRSGEDGFRLWPNHAETLVSATRVGFRPLPYILWKKPTNKPNAFLGSGFLPPNAYVTLDCEYILLFRKGGLRRFPAHDPRRTASRLSRVERDRWFSQVWDDVRGTPQRRTGGRTGAFPPEIPHRLVRMFSVVGDTVLDPFAGTGTTLWSAADAGRNAVGVEYDTSVYRDLVREAVQRRRASSGVPRVTDPGS